MSWQRAYHALRLLRQLDRVLLVIALVALGACTAPEVGETLAVEVEFAVPQDLFARVNGVNLHYLDWGGSGDLMLFLPGMTHTAHTFDVIAPAFTDQYRVMGLTRRGHGASESPESGYDLETLVDDIVAFLNAVGRQRTILVGHSFAGLELPIVASRLPDRIAGLVFLDSVYDWRAIDTAEQADVYRFWQPPGEAFSSREALDDWHRRREPSLWGPVYAATLRSQTYLSGDGRVGWQMSSDSLAQFGQTVTSGTDYRGVFAPVLAVWANQTEASVRDLESYGFSEAEVSNLRTFFSTSDFASKQRGLELLKESVPDAVVVEMDAPHVLHWYAPDEVIQIMKDFVRERVK